MTYQWQRSKDEGKTWTDISGETSEALNVTIQSSDFGSQYRCIAKDFMGHVATSQAGKLASSIASQSAWDPEYTIINEPDDYYGRPGDIATFIVEAEGKNLSYQWLYQAPGSDEFVYCTSSDATTNTLRVEMTTESDGAQYRCFITDANGDMGSTRCATVKLDVRDWTMEYEAGGLRTKRSSAEKTYNYIYSGNQLVRMTCGDNILDFTYDANGAPLTLVTGGKVYYYLTNLQGDVMSIESSDGTPVASYCYDAWGKILACDGALAELNPLRYRSYVYDQETGFYYLQSRYYDPTIRRFINTDCYVSTGRGIAGYNMFAYCNNSPVSQLDPNGEIAITTLILIGSAVLGTISAGYTAYKEYKAGCSTGRIIGDSICAGFASFSVVYSGGISLYQCYQNYCYLQGLTPVTDITFSTGTTTGPYANLTDPPNVGPGKDFSAAQKAQIIRQNRRMNGGVVRSDMSGVELTRPQKSMKGVTPSPLEWQIDHIIPKSAGGTNSYANAQVLSRLENRVKWDH